MVYKLSPSSINLMKNCPRCFWLAMNKKVWRPSSGFPSLPNGMDRVLKRHFDSFIGKGLPPELCENSECESCELFDDKEKLKEWRSNMRGISWTDEEGNVLHGAVDNILVKNGKLIVLDYKTRGFALKEDTHKHYQDQLDLYTYLLQKNGYETEDFAYLLFYVPEKVAETGEVIFDTKLLKVKVDIENAENLFKDALKLLKGECPAVKEDCDWCKLIISDN